MEPCIDCDDETADRKFACGCAFCIYCLTKKTMTGFIAPFCPDHFQPEVPLYSQEEQRAIEVGEMPTPDSFGGTPVLKRSAEEMESEVAVEAEAQGVDNQLAVALPPIPDFQIAHMAKYRRVNPDDVEDEVLEHFNQTPPEMSEDEVEMPMDVPAMANWWFLDDPPRRHKYARRMPYYKRRYGRRRSYRRRSYGGRSKSFGLGPMVRGLSRALRLFLSRSNKYRYRR